jgi:hypothetical protein
VSKACRGFGAEFVVVVIAKRSELALKLTGRPHPRNARGLKSRSPRFRSSLLGADILETVSADD